MEIVRWLVGGWVVLLLGSGCSTAIPDQYLKNVQPGLTFSLLKTKPEAYRGQSVVLGGVIVETREDNGRVWLLVKNRPLDSDYVPHVPVSGSDPEVGEYWVMVSPEGLSPSYKGWSRVTVVGLVSDVKAPKGARWTNLVLAGTYMRGWGSNWGGYGQRADIWEDNKDASYLPSTPMKTKPE
jgi:starvation-inducible outer membrane lipoprotein